MISAQTISQITKLVHPGTTIYYSELKDIKDNKTLSDPKGEIAKALSSNNVNEIAQIVAAIYKNERYNGELVTDKGKVKLVSNGTIYDLKVTNNGSILKVQDTLNRKDTTIEYKTSTKKEVKVSLQDQILLQLKKRRYSDKELIAYIRELEKGIK